MLARRDAHAPRREMPSFIRRKVAWWRTADLHSCKHALTSRLSSSDPRLNSALNEFVAANQHTNDAPRACLLTNASKPASKPSFRALVRTTLRRIEALALSPSLHRQKCGHWAKYALCIHYSKAISLIMDMNLELYMSIKDLSTEMCISAACEKK